MRTRMSLGGPLLVLALAAPMQMADAQWSIAMRVMRNPLPLGECSYVEIVVRDAQGRQGPMRPDGKQASGWDFDFAIVSSAPDAFRLQNDDVTRPFICAVAPTAPTATFIAHYPGQQLKPNQIVPGVEMRQSVEVAMAGVPVPTAAQGGAYPQSNPTYAAGAGQAGAYPTGAPQPGAYPAGAGPYPQGDPYAAGAQGGAYQGGAYGAGAGGYPSGGAYPPGGAYPQGAADPQAGGYAQGAYPQGSAGAGYPQGGAAPAAGATMSPTGAPQDTGVRSAKGFFQRITGHAKRKATEVAVGTTTHVADAAGDVVGNTLEAGSDVVKSGTGAVTGVASESVQGVGRTLGASPAPRDPPDVAASLAGGRAVFYGLKFAEGTAVLDPSSGPLISQIAGALARTPGQFLIEAHVDGKNPAAAQTLSEQRAGAVKAALVAAGSSPMQLAAVGYGSTRPLPNSKTSARIEIARTQ